MRRTAFLFACCLIAGGIGSAQTLSPQVRAFVKVDAPVVALTHVRVIDGTGAAAREERRGLGVGSSCTSDTHCGIQFEEQEQNIESRAKRSRAVFGPSPSILSLKGRGEEMKDLTA